MNLDTLDRRDRIDDLDLPWRQSLRVLRLPDDLDKVWYNVHTGSEGTLERILSNAGMTPSGMIVQPFTDEYADRQVRLIVDHWEVKTSLVNPVIEASLAFREDDVMDDLVDYFKWDLERSEDLDSFKKTVTGRGGSMQHGSSICDAGSTRVTMHDGREFKFSAKQIYDHHHSGQLTLI